MPELKKNCWEVMECGREPDGAQVFELGVCPAALKHDHEGQNGGENAGRICWAVSGTFCHGVAQGTFAQKQHSCLACPFLQMVIREEGEDFVPL